jgi:hypothetical protein
MKKFSIIFALAFVALGTATTNTGCGGSKGGGTGTGGSGATTGETIMVSPDGFIAGDTNTVGITGAWYSYGDYYGGTPTMAGGGDCPVMGGFTVDQCSMIVTPVPGQPFSNTNSNMCTTGTVAKTIPMAGSTSPAYSAIWGAGIGFDLNNGGTDDGGTGIKQPYNATANGVTGFAFDITGSVPVGGQMRIEFPTAKIVGTTDINAAYWGGATAGLSPFNKAGTYSFHWADVGGPMYLASPTPFDPTTILSMQFHVVANTSSTVPYDFCVTNLRALKD